jgi:hypothetical protein
VLVPDKARDFDTKRITLAATADTERGRKRKRILGIREEDHRAVITEKLERTPSGHPHQLFGCREEAMKDLPSREIPEPCAEACEAGDIGNDDCDTLRRIRCLGRFSRPMQRPGGTATLNRQRVHPRARRVRRGRSQRSLNFSFASLAC